MHVRMDVWRHVCMHVCMCLYIHHIHNQIKETNTRPSAGTSWVAPGSTTVAASVGPVHEQMVQSRTLGL